MEASPTRPSCSNHENLWFGGVSDPIPDISNRLPELREMLAKGDFDSANMFYTNILNKLGYRNYFQTYHPAFDLKLNSDTDAAFRDYERELDSKRVR